MPNPPISHTSPGAQEVTNAINRLTAAINNTLAHRHDQGTPTGTINGSNKEFTLPYAPDPAGTLQLFLNGVYQSAAGEDYTLSTLTITFVNAPPTGSVLRYHLIY